MPHHAITMPKGAMGGWAGEGGRAPKVHGTTPLMKMTRERLPRVPTGLDMGNGVHILMVDGQATVQLLTCIKKTGAGLIGCVS